MYSNFFFKFNGFVCSFLLFLNFNQLEAQQKHIYLANDNHTDYFWTANADAYVNVALNEIDYYLNLTDATANLPTPYQSRYNLDGAWYAYVYQQNRTPEQFQRLIDQIKSGHISLPLNYLVSTFGGQPAEAILRGMYWQGSLQRKFDLDLDLAVSMENQTQPLGLASLWAGSGAKYSWKGVCGCASTIQDIKLTQRNHEIYKYQGLDDSFVLMKWYPYQYGSYVLGGYAEARNLLDAISRCEDKCNSSSYPYNIAGAFGKGGDDLELLDDDFPQVAQSESNDERQIYVSNEVDFFEHFKNTFDINNLPVESLSYGNEWDINCATLAPITSKIKNAVEKLRTAEAMASVVSLFNPEIYPAIDPDREKAWIALGSYWEHNFGLSGCCYSERNDWHISLQQQVSNHVEDLFESSLDELAANIRNDSPNMRFFVFNSLNWKRTDYADMTYEGDTNIKIIDVVTNTEVPFQIIDEDNTSHLRILAENVPAVGYKVFEIQAGPSISFPETVMANGQVFENLFYRITITPEGVITSLIDKLNGNQEFVAETNGRYLNDFGQGNGTAGTMVLLNNGPVSATISCTSLNPLQHNTRITLFKAVNRINIDNTISDTYGDDIRTYSFSFNFEDPTMWHEELGAILKAKSASNGGHYADSEQPVRHEWQTLNHFARIGTENKGVTLSNKDAVFMKLGNSTTSFLDETAAQINVLIGGIMIETGNPYISNQYGLTEFPNAFALQTHSESFDASQSMKFAMEHQTPLVAHMIVSGGTTLSGSTYSLFENPDSNLIIWTLKPSEEGTSNGGLIIRAWNMDTLDHSSVFDFTSDVLMAKKTTHLETDLENAMITDGNLIAELGQQKMETFRVFLDASPNSTYFAPEELMVNVFPNPLSSNVLFVETQATDEKINLNVFNLKGQLILNRILENSKNEIDLNQYPSGIYIFSFEENDKRVSKKVFVND